MSDDNITSLYDFINRAQNNRKYLPNVATNFRTPLRLFEKELNEEEKNSLDLFKSRLDEIVNVIYSRPNNILSAASLGVYKRRILQLIADFNNYGKDPNKMASWNRISKPYEKKEGKILKEQKKHNLHTETVTFTDNAVEVGEFKLILPNDWDMNKTRQAIVKGEFSTIYNELTGLSSKLKKEKAGELAEE